VLSLARFASASARVALSSAARRSARPQLQSLQARRRFVLGLHASAVDLDETLEMAQKTMRAPRENAGGKAIKALTCRETLKYQEGVTYE
jgi:hypothetical protein